MFKAQPTPAQGMSPWVHFYFCAAYIRHTVGTVAVKEEVTGSERCQELRDRQVAPVGAVSLGPGAAVPAVNS